MAHQNSSYKLAISILLTVGALTAIQASAVTLGAKVLTDAGHENYKPLLENHLAGKIGAIAGTFEASSGILLYHCMHRYVSAFRHSRNINRYEPFIKLLFLGTLVAPITFILGKNELVGKALYSDAVGIGIIQGMVLVLALLLGCGSHCLKASTANRRPGIFRLPQPLIQSPNNPEIMTALTQNP